jgi:hypothetical protein
MIQAAAIRSGEDFLKFVESAMRGLLSLVMGGGAEGLRPVRLVGWPGGNDDVLVFQPILLGDRSHHQVCQKADDK